MAAPNLFRLGDIAFGLKDGVRDWDETGEAALVEQEVLMGAPKLQFLGTKLTEHELTIQLDVKITTDPRTAIDDLKAARDAGLGLAFHAGDGTYLGRFAVKRIRVKFQRFSPQDMSLIRAEVGLSLLEFVESEPLRTVPRPKSAGRAIAKKADHKAKTDVKPGVIVNSDGYAQPTQGRRS